MVHVDGPYGDSGERPAWLKHSVLAIFAGGIGVRLLHEPLSLTGAKLHPSLATSVCQVLT